MNITLIAPDFEGLKSLAPQIIKRVVETKSYKAMPISGGSTGGCSFNIEYQCPTTLRIAELRREADELERGLGAPPTIPAQGGEK